MHDMYSIVSYKTSSIDWA